MKKRILPALLALCMVMSLLPVAFAAVPDKCSCDGTPTGCSHEANKCEGTEGLAEDQSVCDTCKAAKEADDNKTPEDPAKELCGINGCTGEKDHEGKHTYAKCANAANIAKGTCPGDAGTHGKNCPDFVKCDKCDKETGHKDAHSGTACTEDDKCPASTHTAKCPMKCTCTSEKSHPNKGAFCTNTKAEGSELCASCAANANCNPCTESKDGSCKATTHKDGCDMKCAYDANTGTVTVGEKKLCASCAKDAAKNPCGAGAKDGKGGCTKVKGHTDKHNSVNCTNDEFCNASTHTAGCKMQCTYSSSAGWKYDPSAKTWSANSSAVTCDRTKGHTGAHHLSADVCDGTATCGASIHYPGELKQDADGKDIPGQYKEGEEPCKVLTKSNQCGKGGCTLAIGHIGNHNNTECLGYKDDGRCGMPDGKHIAGCGGYVKCICDHKSVDNSSATGADAWKAAAKFTAGKCTEKADCPNCADWNAFVTALKNAHAAQQKAYLEYQANGGAKKAVAPSEFTGFDYCSCVACGAAKTNPGMGTVVDAEGNPVDPADPTEPTTPTKAEDFTDMEDWMVADVQTALDKGWMQGEGETFNGRGVTTGATIAAVLARMDGETITGATWSEDALKWAEGKDVFEGVELTGESLARKDLVLVIWRMAGKPTSDFELTFKDVDTLEGDHLTAMKWAAENKIVLGNGDDTVTPDGSVTRAALCAMLARYDGLEK